MRGGKAAGAGAGVAVAAVLVCTVVVPLGAAAPQGGVPVPPDVQAAQALISLAYPELRDRSLTLHFTAADGGLRVRVAEAVNPVSAPAGVVVPDLVEATVQLGADGRLVRFRAEGVLVASAARRALALALRAHPQWTEAERQARLMALGARQVPPGRFDARLDLARWARFLGASALISAAAFDWGTSARAGAAVDRSQPRRRYRYRGTERLTTGKQIPIWDVFLPAVRRQFHVRTTAMVSGDSAVPSTSGVNAR